MGKNIEYLEKIKCIIEVAEEEKKEIFSKKMEENKINTKRKIKPIKSWNTGKNIHYKV